MRTQSFYSGVKYSSLSFALVVAGFLFAGCASQTNAPQGDMQIPAATDKQGDTTKVGLLTEINGQYFLQQSAGIPEQVESLSVDLSGYVGKNVTVTGQYSGDTLFIGSINSNGM